MKHFVSVSEDRRENFDARVNFYLEEGYVIIPHSFTFHARSDRYFVSMLHKDALAVSHGGIVYGGSPVVFKVKQ